MKLLIIGMGPKNGMSIAKRFGREGFEILMIARGEDKLREFEQELHQAGIRTTGYAVDIADEESYQMLLDRLAAEHPDLDVLLYNASAFNPAPPSQISIPVFMSDLKINVIGVIRAYQAFFPHFTRRRDGVIFLTGGGTALQAPPALASLGIGKAGIRNLALTMAQECRPHNIHVATITICGMVQAGTRFDPDLIADEYWRLYNQPKDAWDTEIMWE